MSFQFKYKLTEDDYAEFNAFALWHAPWLKKERIKYLFRTALYSGVSMAAVRIILQKINPPKKSHPELLIILGAIILLIIVLLSNYQAPFGIKAKARKLISKEENAAFFNESEIDFGEQGITNIDKQQQTFLKWESVVKFAQTKEYFFVYTSSVQAIILPKRLLKSQKEIESFKEYLLKKIPISSSFRSS